MIIFNANVSPATIYNHIIAYYCSTAKSKFKIKEKKGYVYSKKNIVYKYKKGESETRGKKVNNIYVPDWNFVGMITR